MKTLPNGIKVFNATPHDICFWAENWAEAVVVSPDETISAQTVVTRIVQSREGFEQVTVKFEPIVEGQLVIEQARAAGADVIVGSIIAAQAYRGQVVAMLASPGYERERVPAADKRMDPSKFIIYP